MAGGEAFVWVSRRWGLDVWSYCRCRNGSLPRCAVLRETVCRTSTIEVLGWFARVIMSICSVQFKILPALRRLLRPGQAKLDFLKKAIKKRTQNGVRFLNLFLDPDRCPPTVGGHRFGSRFVVKKRTSFEVRPLDRTEGGVCAMVQAFPWPPCLSFLAGGGGGGGRWWWWWSICLSV